MLSNFGFLRTYGLKPVKENVTLVRYESDAVFTNMYHGRGSFEIGVEIGRLDRPKKYGLDYLVSWAGKEAWGTEGFGRGTMFQVSTRAYSREVDYTSVQAATNARVSRRSCQK